MEAHNETAVAQHRRAAGLLAAICLTPLASPAFAAPSVTTADYGTTKTGDKVQVFTLKNDAGLSARILDLGGILDRVDAPDRKGVKTNVIVGFKDLAGYETWGSMSALTGRFANRIRNGFTLDGKHYELAANPKGVTLHGGRPGYSSRILKSSTFANADGAGVKLTLVSPDGDQGFPGTLTLNVTYTLTKTNDLRIDYEATTDKPTVLNLTNHTYFNMAGGGSANDQLLQVNAQRYTPTDPDQVPTGDLAPVAGTPLDFRKLTPIGKNINSSDPLMLYGRGFDHNYVLDKPAGDPLPLAARLYDPKSGRVLELRTTEPGVQVYSSNNFNGGQVNWEGKTLRQGDGLALETQHYPDSPNKPQFPTTELRPGQTFKSTTLMHFTTDGGKPLR